LLLVDVDLLGFSAIEFFRSLTECVGTNPVDVGRHTISSYAFYCVNLHLYRTKAPSLYTPNMKPLLHLIRKSAVGGLCMVLRHSAKAAGPAINSHFVPEAEWERGKRLFYFDENRWATVICLTRTA